MSQLQNYFVVEAAVNWDFAQEICLIVIKILGDEEGIQMQYFLRLSKFNKLLRTVLHINFRRNLICISMVRVHSRKNFFSPQIRVLDSHINIWDKFAPSVAVRFLELKNFLVKEDIDLIEPPVKGKNLKQENLWLRWSLKRILTKKNW